MKPTQDVGICIESWSSSISFTCSVLIKTSENVFIAKLIYNGNVPKFTSFLAPEDDISLFWIHSWLIGIANPAIVKRFSCIPAIYSTTTKRSDRESSHGTIVTGRIYTLDSICSVKVYFLSVKCISIFFMEHFYKFYRLRN